MGVTSLWEILDPVGQKGLSLSELSGKTLAVDLSAWLVQMKTAGSKAGFHNMYIRSLFFRVLDFLKLGIQLVFVVDGRAPDVKHKTMVQRQQQQFGSAATCLSSPDRLWMSSQVDKCVELLDCLGIPCVNSPGEAEALGAHLSKLKKIDGFISPDSDYFCYGGHTLIKEVYKENKNYYYDIYSMTDIEGELQLNQRDLISLALLLGCDYDKEGVKYIGRMKAMELIEYFKNKSLDSLDRIAGWHDNKELDDIEEAMMNQKQREPHCTRCEHLGKVTVHKTSGCHDCTTTVHCKNQYDTVPCNCPWHTQRRLLDTYKVEINVRRKACTECASGFPNKEIIDEYLQSDTELSKKAIKWTNHDPNIPRIVRFLQNHLSWEGQKVMEYLYPAVILSRLRTQEQSAVDLKPVKILRPCKDNHLECYEVEWSKLACDQWTVSDTVIVKVEKQLLEEKFGELVKSFNAQTQSARKSTGKKRKTDLTQTKITSYTKIKKKIDFSVTKLPEKNGVTRTQVNGESINQIKPSVYGQENGVITID